MSPVTSVLTADARRVQVYGDQVYQFYQRLPSTGKPSQGQWTTVAAIIEEDFHGTSKVSSLATGTKCVTGKPSNVSNCIVDTHAESLLKRAFKCRLIKLLAGPRGVEGAIGYLKDVQIILFISQMPCGVVDRFAGSTVSPDWQGPRRKPGKGESSVKCSCADKLCKWLNLGLQGRRLYNLLGKLPFKSLVIGNCVEECEFNLQQLEKRIAFHLPPPGQSDAGPDSEVSKKRFKRELLSIYFCPSFKHQELTRSNSKKAFNLSMVAWIDNDKSDDGDFVIEKLVDGRKQGTSVKNYNKSNSNLLAISDVRINQQLDQIKCPVECEEYTLHWQRLLNTQRFTGWSEVKFAK